MSQPRRNRHWRQRNKVGYKSALVRLLALALVLGPFLAPQYIPTWPAVIAWFFVWLTAFSKRSLFRRNIAGLPRLAKDTAGKRVLSNPPKVAVVSPGRNEEDGIEDAARSLAALDYPNLEVLVVDDHSTDTTGAILNRLASELPQIRVFHDPPFQDGWLGKANAVWFAVHQTSPDVEWLVLTDADVVFAPEAVREAVALAEEQGLDFLTCIPLLETGTFSERLALPLHWHGLVSGCHPDRIGTPAMRPVGIGAFNMVKRKAYLDSGGHSAFHARQPEDALLAETVQDWGGKLGIAWTPDLLHVRLYRGYDQLMRYWVRKNRVTGEDRPWYFISMALLMTLLYVLPLPLFLASLYSLFSHGYSLSMALYALLAGATYFNLASALKDAQSVCRTNTLMAYMHPIAGAMRVLVELKSFWGVIWGHRMDWRGRAFVTGEQAPSGASSDKSA